MDRVSTISIDVIWEASDSAPPHYPSMTVLCVAVLVYRYLFDMEVFFFRSNVCIPVKSPILSTMHQSIVMIFLPNVGVTVMVAVY